MKKIDTNELQDYFKSVVERAENNAHGIKVHKVLLLLFGAILFFKDRRKDIKVYFREGRTANVLWTYFKGKRYAFAFNHESCQIELRERSLQGPVVATFDNATSTNEVYRIFTNL